MYGWYIQDSILLDDLHAVARRDIFDMFDLSSNAQYNDLRITKTQHEFLFIFPSEFTASILERAGRRASSAVVQHWDRTLPLRRSVYHKLYAWGYYNPSLHASMLNQCGVGAATIMLVLHGYRMSVVGMILSEPWKCTDRSFRRFENRYYQHVITTEISILRNIQALMAKGTMFRK